MTATTLSIARKKAPGSDEGWRALTTLGETNGTELARNRQHESTHVIKSSTSHPTFDRKVEQRQTIPQQNAKLQSTSLGCLREPGNSSMYCTFYASRGG